MKTSKFFSATSITLVIFSLIFSSCEKEKNWNIQKEEKFSGTDVWFRQKVILNRPLLKGENISIEVLTQIWAAGQDPANGYPDFFWVRGLTMDNIDWTKENSDTVLYFKTAPQFSEKMVGYMYRCVLSGRLITKEMTETKNLKFNPAIIEPEVYNEIRPGENLVEINIILE